MTSGHLSTLRRARWTGAAPGAYPHTPALNANATSGAKEAIPAGPTPPMTTRTLRLVRLRLRLRLRRRLGRDERQGDARRLLVEPDDVRDAETKQGERAVVVAGAREVTSWNAFGATPGSRRTLGPTRTVSRARRLASRARGGAAAAAAAARVDSRSRARAPAGVERRARELAAAPEEALEHRRGLRGGRALRAIRAEEEEAKHAVAAAGETRARRARAQATHRLHRREAPGVRARERDRLGRRRRGRHRDRSATEARAREPPRRRARNRATNDAQPRAPGRIRATSDDATRPGGSESVGRTTRRDRHFVGSHRRSIVGSILQLDTRRSADTHTLVVLLPSLSHVAPTPSPPRKRSHPSTRAAPHLSPRRVILPFVPSFLRASVDHPRRRPARFAGPVRIPSVARAALLPGSYGVRRPPLLFSSPPLSEPSEPSSALFLLARIARPSLCDGDARSPSTLRWSPPTRRASSETSPSATRSFPVFSSAFRSRLVLSPSRPPPGPR